MEKTILNPPTLAKPSGYAHGVLIVGGRLLVIAGQTGMDNTGRIAAPGNIIAQFQQALANIKEVVAAAGGQMPDIVKMTVYVTRKTEYQANLKPIGAAYQSFFGKYYPAIALIEVNSLWDEEALIEIESVAVMSEQ